MYICQPYSPNSSHPCLLGFSLLVIPSQGFPHSSVGKESTCSAGDPGSIPGSGRSAGEGIGYPLQHSWAFLSPCGSAGKNPPAMQETWVQSLGWEDPTQEKTTHSNILACRIPWIIQVHGVARSQTWLSDFHFLCILSTKLNSNQGRVYAFYIFVLQCLVEGLTHPKCW